MFFDINKNLCDTFPGLDPIKLLDYPAEDVFNLINDIIDYNQRNKSDDEDGDSSNSSKEICVPAGDDWF